MKVMGFMLSHLPRELSFLTIYAAHLIKSWSVKEMRRLTCQFFNLSNSWKVDFPFVLCFLNRYISLNETSPKHGPIL